MTMKPEPVEAKYREMLNAVAAGLDDVLNPDPSKPKTTGFMLTVFDFNNPNGGRFNYISNADKLDVRAMLKDVIARIEGRLQAETITKQ